MDYENGGFERSVQRYACTGRGWVKLITWFFSMLAWTILVSRADYAEIGSREFTAFVFVLIWLSSIFIYLCRACALGFITNKEVHIELAYTSFFTVFSFIAGICISMTTCVDSPDNFMGIGNSERFQCVGKTSFESSAVFCWFTFFLVLWDLQLAIKLRNGVFFWQR